MMCETTTGHKKLIINFDFLNVNSTCSGSQHFLNFIISLKGQFNYDQIILPTESTMTELQAEGQMQEKLIAETE